MKTVEVKFKKLIPEATLPKYAKLGDACMDLTATSESMHETGEYIEYGTGLAMEIPEGYVGLIYPRSSITTRNLMLKNSVGVIDSGYRGEIKFRFAWRDGKHYEVGERIGQIMVIPIPKMEILEVAELSTTERGEGGYGSSGTH